MRVYWQETVSDTPGATSTVSITDIKFATNTYYGWLYNADMVIKINGTVAVSLDIDDGNQVYPTYTDQFYSVTRGGNLITGSVSGIAHDSQGNKTVNITVEPNPNTTPDYAGFWRQFAPFKFTTSSISKSIALTRIPVGTLSISAGTGSTISVTKGGTDQTAGTNLYYGDQLVITFGVTSGYTLATHTVNGTTFASGGTHSVTGNVTVAATATRMLTTISTGNGTFGTAQTITVTRYNSSYTHSIIASVAGQHQTVASKVSTLSISWTPDPSMMNAITSAMSASCTLTCTTYNGNTSLGTSSITVTLALPTSGTYSVKPTPSISDLDANGYYSTFGAYVAGKSALSVSINDGRKYSATIASRSTSANGVSSGAASFNAGTLTANTTISTTVKDSRGQTGTASANITVLSYTSPSITTFAVRRTDQNGNADDMGDYFTVSWAASVIALNNHNNRSLTLRYKRVSASTWTSQAITMSDWSDSGTTAAFAASGDYSWDVQLVLVDYFETVTKSTKLSTAAVVESRYPEGNGVAFGKVAEVAGLFDVAWSSRFRNTLRIDGELTLAQRSAGAAATLFGGSSLPNGSDLNDDTILSGCYWCSSTDVANIPGGHSYGYLLVFSNSANTKNGVQIFLAYNSTYCYWRMYINSQWYAWRRISGTSI